VTLQKKMATPEQKEFCVLQFATHESVVSIQLAFGRQFQCDFPLPTALDVGISGLRQRGACQKKVWNE
jgi:hypothetical protein